MSCFSLTNAINALCPVISKGFERVGYICNYADIDQESITFTDNKGYFTLKSGQFYPVYDHSIKPFEGSKVDTEESSPHGFKLFNDTVTFPMMANNVLNADAIETLKNATVVVVLENKEKAVDHSARYHVFGLSGGLVPTSIVNDSASDVAYVVSLQDKNTNSAGLFIWSTSKAVSNEITNAILNAVQWVAGTYDSGVYVWRLSHAYVSNIDDNTTDPDSSSDWTLII